MKPSASMVVAIVALVSSLTGGALAGAPGQEGDQQRITDLEARVVDLDRRLERVSDVADASLPAGCFTKSAMVTRYTDPKTGQTYLDAQRRLGQKHLLVLLTNPACGPKRFHQADLGWTWTSYADKAKQKVSK